MANLKKNIRSIFIIGSIVKLLGLFYKIVLTRILGIEGMTVYSLVFPALSLSICLSSFSIPVVCNQNLSYNEAKHIYPISAIMKASARIIILTSSVVSLIILLSFPIYKYVYHDVNLYYPLLLTIPLIFFSNTSGVLKSYFEAKKEFRITQLSNLFEQTVKIAFSLLLLYIFRNYNIYTKVFIAYLALSFSEIFSFCYLAFKIKYRGGWRNTQTYKMEMKLFFQAAPLTLERFVVTLCAFFEPFIITIACNKAGITQAESERFFALTTSYAIPLLIMASFTSESILKASFPFFCATKDNKKEAKFYIDKAFYSCLFTALINFNICFFYPDFVLKLLFNSTSSVEIVKILAPCFLLYYFEPILRGLLQANKLEKNYLINTIIAKATTIILIWFLCRNPKIGLNGFVIAIALGTITQNLLDYYLITRRIHYHISFKALVYVVSLIALNIFMTLILNPLPRYLNCLLTNSFSLGLLLFYKAYQKRKLTLSFHH